MSVVVMLKPSRALVVNDGTGPVVRTIAGKPVAKIRRAGTIIRFDGPETRSVVRERGSKGRPGRVRILRSDAPADVVADAWEYRARTAGVFSGRKSFV
jgi:hypothetical protein